MGRTACTSSVAPSPWRCCWTPRCPALPHLVAAFRQDLGLAYSEYGAALALFVETQHSRLCTTQAAWLTHPHIYTCAQITNISQSFVDIFTNIIYYLHTFYAAGAARTVSCDMAVCIVTAASRAPPPLCSGQFSIIFI